MVIGNNITLKKYHLNPWLAKGYCDYCHTALNDTGPRITQSGPIVLIQTYFCSTKCRFLFSLKGDYEKYNNC